MHSMRRSVVCLCVSISLTKQLALQNGRTDRDAVSDVELGGPKNHVLDRRQDLATERITFEKDIFSHAMDGPR